MQELKVSLMESSQRNPSPGLFPQLYTVKWVTLRKGVRRTGQEAAGWGEPWDGREDQERVPGLR